ncbi:MAG: type II toxin-antitoxin system VapC family toxin [Phormidium sp. BM_Day4_Bin.17]|nr:type II toxin-antitoxin system VapC family toxin [Phormidium sp. BM_Day4_Bin.17]UCJ10530.1 MAG: type II toxin-antitoxin system VapC family toxin [Phormidium sp. PBR-2020]
MYLLDTNICIALLKNHPNAVPRFAQHFQSSYLSSIVVSELYKGVYCSQKIEQNLATFISFCMHIMEIHELVVEMKILERRLTLYEEKYGVLSEDFYKALFAGNLARYDEYDETRTDFSRWKGIYETWLRRKRSYTEQINQRELAETLRFRPTY